MAGILYKISYEQFWAFENIFFQLLLLRFLSLPFRAFPILASQILSELSSADSITIVISATELILLTFVKCFSYYDVRQFQQVHIYPLLHKQHFSEILPLNNTIFELRMYNIYINDYKLNIM